MPQGRRALLQRVDDFLSGQWQALHAHAHTHAAARPPTPAAAEGLPDSLADGRRSRACSQVQQGNLSRASQLLTASPLAPGTEATLAALSDPDRRPPALLRPIPQEAFSGAAPGPCLQPREVAEALRTAKRGTAPGLSGATMDHYKLFLADEEALALLTAAVNLLASAAVPPAALAALRMARLTALAKPGGGVRGIATGDAFRRLTSRILARHFAADLDAATRPFQYALSTRTGTDAIAALLRAATDADPDTAILSLDGRSAYDCMSRAAIFAEVHSSVPALLPFTQAFYGSSSSYLWFDAASRQHVIPQGEGVEQGDALAPGLFALGQHRALVRASEGLAPGDTLLAYLDDLYVLTRPHRARDAFDRVAAVLEHHTGIRSNLGKTRCYTRRGGPAPAGIAALGPDVWCADGPPAARGFVALGTPIGDPAFSEAYLAERLERQAALLRELPLLPDLQAAWLLLSYCAAPRAQHILRTLPPSASRPYAEAHDAAVAATLSTLLGEPAGLPAHALALAFLPSRLGGLGLACSVRVIPAYWAAWADALPVLAQRAPAALRRPFCLSLRQLRLSGRSCSRWRFPRLDWVEGAPVLGRLGPGLTHPPSFA